MPLAPKDARIYGCENVWQMLYFELLLYLISGNQIIGFAQKQKDLLEN